MTDNILSHNPKNKSFAQSGLEYRNSLQLYPNYKYDDNVSGIDDYNISNGFTKFNVESVRENCQNNNDS